MVLTIYAYHILTDQSFGWVNASYVYGLSLLKDHAKRAIGTMTPYEVFEKATQAEDSLEDVFEDGEESDRAVFVDDEEDPDGLVMAGQGDYHELA